MAHPIEHEHEVNGRWIATTPDLPGALCYGDNQQEALARVCAPSRQKSSGIAGSIENRFLPGL